MYEYEVLRDGVYERARGVDPVEGVYGGNEPCGPGPVCNAVELDAAEDHADAEPEGADEEGFGGVVEGAEDVGGVEDAAGEHEGGEKEEEEQV